MTVESTQDQTVKPGEEAEAPAGEVTEAVETATTEEGGLLGSSKKADNVSVEDIMSEAAPEAGVGTSALVGEEEGVSPKSQEKINRKIGDAIRDKKTAQEEAKRANDRVAELEAQQSVPKERPLAPLREDFETGPEYQEAMSKYQDDTIAYNNAQGAVEKQKANDKSRSVKNIQRFMNNSERMKAKFSDFDALVNQGENIFGHLDKIILESEYSPEVAYYLAKNPEQLESFKSLDVNEARHQIGGLSSRFKTVQKKKTTAPKPIVPVNTGTDSAVPEDINKIKDSDRWFRERNKAILRERNGPT